MLFGLLNAGDLIVERYIFKYAVIFGGFAKFIQEGTFKNTLKLPELNIPAKIFSY